MVTRVEYDLAPVPTIGRFMDSSAFIRGLMGPFGSGKSSGCVMEVVQRGCLQRPGPDRIRRTRWAVIRNTYMQLKDTTINTFHQWFPPHMFGEWRVTDHRYIIRAFEKTEVEVLFRALDRPEHVSNLLSMDLTGAWVNEAREVPWAVIEMLQARVGRYPAMRDGGPTWHGIMMDTNPPDVDSRWYKFFEEPDPDTGKRQEPSFAALFRQPSGRGPSAENLANLPPNYYQNMIKGKDPEWVKVYVDGEYGFVIDGLPVFPEYHDPTHCRPVQCDSLTPVYRGWDFGLTPACVLLQVNRHGQLCIFDEVVATSMSVDQFSDEVIFHCNTTYPDVVDWIDIGDPAGESRSPTDSRTCFQILQSKGIMIEAGLQTPAIRIESVKKPLRTMAGKGNPGLIVDPRCKMVRKGFQGGYQYRRMRTSQERYTQLPDKNMYSHPMDALEYPCTRIFGETLIAQRRYPGAEFDSGQQAFDQIERNLITGY